MMRTHLQYVIGTSQDYWLDDKGATSKRHWVDNKGLILASHCYARMVARWLEVLASYAGRSNLTVIMSGIVLKRLKTRRVALSPR